MQTFYLYHEVPKDLAGDTLYPLNVLKDKYPEIYNKKVAKYDDRPEVLNWKVPTLNCLWNDVLHLTAVHPELVKKALLEAGYKGTYEVSCYQIDPRLLDPKKTTVYLYINERLIEGTDPKDFTEFNPSDMGKYSDITEYTKKHYKRLFDKGEKPRIYPWVPHIFYKGSIDVKNLPIIKV
jgi:hypothetical protein